MACSVIAMASSNLFKTRLQSIAPFQALYKLASKAYRQDKVILSSIGFGQDLKAIEFLQKLAKHGHGNFIRINNPDTDMKNLIEEVKKQCKI